MAKRKKSKSRPSKNTPSPSSRSPSYLFWVVMALLGMFVFFFCAVMFLGFIAVLAGEDIDLDGNVAVIDIKGPIVADKASSFGFSGMTSSSDVAKLIEKAEEEDDIKVIMFEINSPGGSAVASAELAQAIDSAEKPTVAVIREVGASGAFWSAMSTDVVFAHPLSVTGSIGVVSSYLQFSGFLDKYNVTYERLVAGDYKDTGSPFKNLTTAERERFQGLLDDIHDEFIISVAEHRDLDVETVRSHADGFVFLGREAQELGYVDELGTKDDAVKYLEREHNMTVELSKYKKTPTLFEALGGVFSGNFYAVGRGIGDSMTSVDNGYLPKVQY